MAWLWFWHGWERSGSSCSNDEAGVQGARVRGAPAAAHLSRGRQGQERDARQPLPPAAGDDRAGAPLAAGRAAPLERGWLRGLPLAAARPCRRRARDGAPARAGAAARPAAVAGALPGAGAGRAAAAAARLEARLYQGAWAVDAGRGAGRRGRRRRPALRGARLAGGAAGADRGPARPPPPRRGRARPLRRLLLLLRGPHLPAARARLLPRRPPRLAADHLRAALRPGGPAGRDRGLPRRPP